MLRNSGTCEEAERWFKKMLEAPSAWSFSIRGHFLGQCDAQRKQLRHLNPRPAFPFLFLRRVRLGEMWGNQPSAEAPSKLADC